MKKTLLSVTNLFTSWVECSRKILTVLLTRVRNRDGCTNAGVKLWQRCRSLTLYSDLLTYRDRRIVKYKTTANRLNKLTNVSKRQQRSGLHRRKLHHLRRNRRLTNLRSLNLLPRSKKRLVFTNSFSALQKTKQIKLILMIRKSTLASSKETSEDQSLLVPSSSQILTRKFLIRQNNISTWSACLQKA
jgi:hypothetical protein